MTIKYKATKPELHINSTDMIIEGFVSIFGNTDLYGDVMLAGSFKKSLERRRKNHEFYHVDDHNFRFHLADVLELDEQATGLYFKSKFYDRERAKFEKVESGDFDGMSFAYAELESRTERSKGVVTNYISEVDIIEISSTRWPVNPLARSIVAKSITREMFFEFAESLSADDASRLKGLLNAPDSNINCLQDIEAWSSDMKKLF